MFLKLSNIIKFCKDESILIPQHWNWENAPRYSPDSDFIFIFDEHYIFRHLLSSVLTKHPKKYTLIYIGDNDFTPQYFECIKDHVKHVYIHGGRWSNPMVSKLPVGFIDNFEPPSNIEEIRKTPKDILCYLPSIGLFDENNLHHLPGRLVRQKCIEYFKTVSFVTKELTKLTQEEYTDKMSKCKFVICPMGVGIDTYKIYESVYMGATPIVIKNGMEDVYEKFGALIIDKWEDITEELLQSHVHYQPPDELFQLEYWIPKLIC
jgi:hypothetical protein